MMALLDKYGGKLNFQIWPFLGIFNISMSHKLMTPIFLFIIYINKENILLVKWDLNSKILKMTHCGPIDTYPIWIEILDSRLFLIILFWNKIISFRARIFFEMTDRQLRLGLG